MGGGKPCSMTQGWPGSVILSESIFVVVFLHAHTAMVPEAQNALAYVCPDTLSFLLLSA